MCGIFGYVAPEPKKFDFTTFCTLGIHNDTRGKDSVGLFIDGQTEYYCKGKNSSLFEDFMESSKLIQTTETCQVAYGHCRAASIGTVSLQTAQPVVIYNGEKVDYVLMHNGTIYNYKELAQKYIPNIDIKDMTDSQVMAQIFYNAGYDALKEYNGGAVFAIIDYRGDKPRYLFWQGSSKKYSTSTTIEEERPLFIALSPEGEAVFSSIYTFLPALRRRSTVYTLTTNTLAELIDGDLYCAGEYDRKDQCQTDQTVKVYTYANNTSNTSYNHNTGASYTTYSSDYVVGSSVDGKCRKGNILLHGNYHISDYGRFVTEAGAQNNHMWFWNGRLLINQDAYMYLDKFQKELGVSIQELDEWYPELIMYLSPCPFYRENVGAIQTLKKVESPLGGFAYTGQVRFPFVKSLYTYTNGIYQSACSIDTEESLLCWKEHKDDKLDYDVLDRF